MKGYDALEYTLILRGHAGKHLGNLSELSFLAVKVARFLFEFHADDYKRRLLYTSDVSDDLTR